MISGWNHMIKMRIEYTRKKWGGSVRIFDLKKKKGLISATEEVWDMWEMWSLIRKLAVLLT